MCISSGSTRKITTPASHRWVSLASWPARFAVSQQITHTSVRVQGRWGESSHRGGNLQFSIRLQLHLFLGICFIWALDLQAETGSRKWSKSDMLRYYTKPKAWHQQSRSRHTNGQRNSGPSSDALDQNRFSRSSGTTRRCESEQLKYHTEHTQHDLDFHLTTSADFIYLLWRRVFHPFS